MVIASGKDKDILSKILSCEEIGTIFTPKISKIESKKRWLLNGKKADGKVIIDDGAERALISQGKSLLPVGIKEVKGKFQQGSVLSIIGRTGKEIGRGISNYTDEELQKIIGKKSDEAEKILGNIPSDEVIHRDHMVII